MPTAFAMSSSASQTTAADTILAGGSGGSQSVTSSFSSGVIPETPQQRATRLQNEAAERERLEAEAGRDLERIQREAEERQAAILRQTQAQRDREQAILQRQQQEAGTVRFQQEVINDAIRRGSTYVAAPASEMLQNSNQTLLSLMQDANFVAAMQERFTGRNRTTQALESNADLTDADLDVEIMRGILLDSLNGQRILPEQVAEVEYIKKSQHLMLPFALGMRVDKTSQNLTWVPDHDVLQERYRRVSALSFSQLANLVRSNATPQLLRAAIEAIDVPATHVLTRRVEWDNPAWYTVQYRELDGHADTIFTCVSHALQFNCDIRDAGYLFLPHATVSDVEWRRAHEVPPTRLMDHLRPHTRLCIAAMNIEPCAGKELGGWVRAYGVSLGILPAANSFCEREITFEAKLPSTVTMKAATSYMKNFPNPHSLLSLSANVLAMFGLFHLNKDHTYRTNDANMERIGTSYVGTLRTGVNDATFKTFDGFKEVLVRTAPHPFGLAQTYFLARVMGNYSMLTSPLAKRVDTTPPPVQRLFIMLTAIGEWAGVPSGKELVKLYEDEVDVMDAERQLVLASPPSYSDLHRCYGIAQRASMTDKTWGAINAVAPCVHGYVVVVHHSSDAKKDGLGYALSLDNIEREAKGQTSSWASAWANHLDGLDGLSIVDYASANLATARAKKTKERRR